jgi:DNA-binding transcriptional regulator YdaS (Cro superfamily)
MAASLYKDAFARAARIIGGREALAAHLRVSVDRLGKWSTNAVRPPIHALESLARVFVQELLRKYGRPALRPAHATARRKHRRR